MNVSVVVPCYRSRETLPELVERLHLSLPRWARRFEVILVVDGSPDDTYAVARRIEQSRPETVRSVLLRRNYGQHNAILAGLARAQYEVTVTMDDDLQHPPEQLGTLLAPLTDPLVDLVYGVSAEEEHGFTRSVASRVVKAGLAAAGVPNARDVSALRAFRTDLRDGFAHVADPFVSVDVLLSWTTLSVRRVQVRMDQRVAGRSGYTLSKLTRHAMNMVTGYGTAPLKLVTWMGLACSALGFGLLIYVLVEYATGSIEVAGFTTLTSLLAMLCGAVMLSIGVLGEYVGRLHFRSMQRPTFLVKEDSRTSGPRAGIPGVELPPVAEQPDDAAIASAIAARHQAPENSRSLAQGRGLRPTTLPGASSASAAHAVGQRPIGPAGGPGVHGHERGHQIASLGGQDVAVVDSLDDSGLRELGEARVEDAR